MAEPKLTKVEKFPISPIVPSKCLLAEHAYRSFDAMLPCGVGKDDLEDPSLYVNLGRQLQTGSELRVTAEDESFIAYLYVMFAHNNDVRVKVKQIVDLQEIEDIGIVERFEIKLCGRSRWCVIDTQDASKVFQDIPTQREAVRTRDDHVSALAR